MVDSYKKILHSSTTAPDGESLHVYPNPVTEGEISLEHPMLASTGAKATISDASGRIILLMQTVFDAAGRSNLVLANALPQGLYILRLQAGDGRIWDNKFIISKN